MPETKEELDWLGRRGGWVLLGLGAALIALAVVVVEHEAVASIFAFAGIATAVLGVLLPRLEGTFEISPTKLVATLKAARSAGAREDLTFDERANEVFKVLGISGDAAPAEAAGERSERPTAPQRKAAWPPLPPPLEFVVTGETGETHAVAAAFERHVAELFRRAGWEVEEPEYGPDAITRKDGATIYVEAKLRRRFSQADARQVIAIMQRLDPSGEARYVLAVNAGALTRAALDELATYSELRVLEVPVEGW